MRPSHPIEYPARGLDATGLHIGDPALDAFDGFDAIQEGLIRLGILHDEFGPSIDRKHQRMSRLSETAKKIHRVPLEVTERSNVVGEIQHDTSLN
jgi:hypothetical protein